MKDEETTLSEILENSPVIARLRKIASSPEILEQLMEKVPGIKMEKEEFNKMLVAFFQDYTEYTQAVWNLRYGREISTKEADEIAHNMENFFAFLLSRKKGGGS